MDIRLLRYFLAVAREENITRAAENLHIAQPSLSKQLMELENEVGKQLLVRGKRKITLRINEFHWVTLPKGYMAFMIWRRSSKLTS